MRTRLWGHILRCRREIVRDGRQGRIPHALHKRAVSKRRARVYVDAALQQRVDRFLLVLVLVYPQLGYTEASGRVVLNLTRDHAQQRVTGPRQPLIARQMPCVSGANQEPVVQGPDRHAERNKLGSLRRHEQRDINIPMPRSDAGQQLGKRRYNESFIAYPRQAGVAVHEQTVALCAKRGFEPYVVQEAQQASTLIGLTATGLGIALVPATLKAIAIPCVVFRELDDDDTKTTLYIAHRHGDVNSRVQQFVELALALR